MRPVPIPDEDFEAAEPPKHRLTIGVEDMDDRIIPVEAIVQDAGDPFSEDTLQFAFKIKLEPGDMGSLLKHGHFWFITYAKRVTPFQFELCPEPEEVKGGKEEAEDG